MFFSNVSALSAPSGPRREGAGGAGEQAGPQQKHPGGSPRLPLQLSPGEPWGSAGLGQKGSGLGDAWLSPAPMQAQPWRKAGDGASLAGGGTRVRVLTPELEPVLPLATPQLTVPHRGCPAAPARSRGVQPPPCHPCRAQDSGCITKSTPKTRPELGANAAPSASRKHSHEAPGELFPSHGLCLNKLGAWAQWCTLLPRKPR